MFGGRSPINDQNRELVAAIEDDLAANGVKVPIYWGNRNWDPYLRETLERMKADGITRVAAVLTSAYSSYSGCRQYRENLAAAVAEVPDAPRIDRLRHYFNHPGFIESMVDATLSALADLPEDARRGGHIAFVTHSIPVSMNDSSGPRGGAYVAQHRVVAAEIIERVREETGHRYPSEVVFCSRSGRPQDPVAGAGHQRPPALPAAPGRPGRRRGADRVRLGPHGGRLRPRPRGPGHRRGDRAARSRAPPRPASTRGSWPWSATSCSSAAPSSAASRSSGRRQGPTRSGTCVLPAAVPTRAARSRRCAARTDPVSEPGDLLELADGHRPGGGRPGHVDAHPRGRRRPDQVQPDRHRHRGRPRLRGAHPPAAARRPARRRLRR